MAALAPARCFAEAAGPHCSPQADIARATDVLAKVNETTTAPSCDSETPSGSFRNDRLGCPHFLMDRVLSGDRKSGWLEQSPSDACNVANPNIPASEIERTLASHPRSSLGAEPDFRAKNCFQDESGKNSATLDRTVITAEYYLNMTRLRSAADGATESIATIDSMLGKKALEGVDCSNPRIPSSERSCATLSQCEPAGGLSEQAETIAELWPAMQKLRKEMASTSSKAGSTGQSSGFAYGLANKSQVDSIAAQGEELRQKEQALAELESSVPAVRGKVFRKIFDPKKRNFEEALRAQLEATRAKLVEQRTKTLDAIECLNSPMTCGKCADFDKTLGSTPEFTSPSFRSGAKATSAELSAQSFLSAVECRQKQRGFREQAGDVVEDFAIGAGLTIVTAGLGSVAAAGKGAAGMFTAARGARAGLAVIDAGAAAAGASSVASKCSELLNQLEQASSSSPSVAGKCPGQAKTSDGKTVPQLVADYQSCVAAASLEGATTILPLLPPRIMKFMKRPANTTERALASSPGLAPTKRLPEERLLSLAPDARRELVANMQLSDAARASKISSELKLAPQDPKVEKLMKLHSDSRYSGTLEASTDELQKKIDDAMDIVVPGYKTLPPEARRAHSATRVEMTDLVRKGVLGQASPEVKQISGKIAQAEIRIQAELKKYSLSPSVIQQKHNQIFRSSTPGISEKAPAEAIVKRVNAMHTYIADMKKAVDVIRDAGIDSGNEAVEQLALSQIREIKAQVKQLEAEISALADIRKPGFEKFKEFGGDDSFDPRAASKELKALLQEFNAY
jgi:hypothetical protein